MTPEQREKVKSIFWAGVKYGASKNPTDLEAAEPLLNELEKLLTLPSPDTL